MARLAPVLSPPIASEQCFCGSPIAASASDDEPSIYCSVRCARFDAMRALELAAAPAVEGSPASLLSTPSSSASPPDASHYLGAGLVQSSLITNIETLLSPCSALSISSSLASAGSPGVPSPTSSSGPTGSENAAQLAHSRSVLHAKGSHYRAMAAAAEKAQAHADALKERADRKREIAAAQSHFSWTTVEGSASCGGSETEPEHLTYEETTTATHTPRLGIESPSQTQSAAANAVERIVSSDMETQTHFMDTVLAQLRLSVASPGGSPTLAQLLPAFGDEAEPALQVDSVPPPPAHPRFSELYGPLAPKVQHAGQAAAAAGTGVLMEVSISTQSDQTLVESDCCAVETVSTVDSAATQFFSPLSSKASRSTMGHSSQPSDASTMTTGSTAASSVTSLSSTRSLAQARELRKELDLELRQMAIDLAELRNREHNAMLYGIAHRRKDLSSLAISEEMLLDEEEGYSGGDAFEFDNAAALSPVLSRRSKSERRASKQRSSYRWSRADKELVARCLSTCLTIVEDEEQKTTNPVPVEKPLSQYSSSARTGNGKQPRQSNQEKAAAAEDLLPSLEYDLAFFLDLDDDDDDGIDDDEDELLRPTYEMPLGFLEQPLVHPSAACRGPQAPPKSAGGQGRLHHSRSTPQLYCSPGLASPTRAAIAMELETSGQNVHAAQQQQRLQLPQHRLRSGSNAPLPVQSRVDFEIMQLTPLQLPARPATAGGKTSPTKLGPRKSGNALASLRDLANSLGSSQPPPHSNAPALHAKASNGSMRPLYNTAAAGNSQLLRVNVGKADQQRSMLARGPGSSANGRPSTPSSPFLASSAAFLASAFSRTPSSSGPPMHSSKLGGDRPLPPAPLEMYGGGGGGGNAYPFGAGIAHDPYGASLADKRLPVTPAGVGNGMSRARALDKLQGLLRRRIAGSGALLR